MVTAMAFMSCFAGLIRAEAPAAPQQAGIIKFFGRSREYNYYLYYKLIDILLAFEKSLIIIETMGKSLSIGLERR